MKTQILRGFATVNYWADDLAAARKWYSEWLGIEPYFERDGGYIEFRVGDSEDELGIVNRRYAPPGTPAGPAGAIIYWHVDDVPATLARLLSMGATGHQPVIERGHGFVTASVVDPFGNILGIMYNPHYVELLGR